MYYSKKQKMKRDSIFYKLFRQSPTLLFELLPDVPDEASRYRFDSVAVKEPKFEIDGVLLPPEGSNGTVFFRRSPIPKGGNAIRAYLC